MSGGLLTFGGVPVKVESMSADASSTGPYSDHPVLGGYPVEIRERIAWDLADGRKIGAVKVLNDASGGSMSLRQVRAIIEALPVIHGDDVAETQAAQVKVPELMSGQIDKTTTLRIYQDGTFSTAGILSVHSTPERLVSLSYDVDSMRRKSTTGRGVAAVLTSGFSLAAANNRGVLYVTVTGAVTGTKTYRTKNPSNSLLSSVRSLQAAAQAATTSAAAQNDPGPHTEHSTQPGDRDIAAQLASLAQLHTSGALSDDEFAAAKSKLLG